MFGLKKLINGNAFGIPRKEMERFTTPPKFTKDGAELQSRKHNLVLLYGNEMEGHRDFNVEVKPVYKDVFTRDPFIMVKVHKGEHVAPVVMEPPKVLLKAKNAKVFAYDSLPGAFTGLHLGKLPPAPVKGELFQLNYREVEALDNHYENGVMFDRIRVSIRVEHYAKSIHNLGYETETRISEALYFEKRVFMYVGRYEPFSRLSISAKSIDLLKQRPYNQNYAPRYFYTRKDW